MREYKKLDEVKEFVNEKDGVICLKIENLYGFLINNKEFKDQLFSFKRFIDIYTYTYNASKKEEKILENNYLSPIISIVKVRDGDTFDLELGRKIATIKLYKKVYTRLGKIATYVNNYYENELDKMDKELLSIAEDLVRYTKALQKFD